MKRLFAGIVIVSVLSTCTGPTSPETSEEETTGIAEVALTIQQMEMGKIGFGNITRKVLSNDARDR